MTTETLTKGAPPKPPNDKKTLVGFPDDEIRELGDRIMQLTGAQAKQLSDYLESQGAK